MSRSVTFINDSVFSIYNIRDTIWNEIWVETHLRYNKRNFDIANMVNVILNSQNDDGSSITPTIEICLWAAFANHRWVRKMCPIKLFICFLGILFLWIANNRHFAIEPVTWINNQIDLWHCAIQSERKKTEAGMKSRSDNWVVFIYFHLNLESYFIYVIFLSVTTSVNYE